MKNWGLGLACAIALAAAPGCSFTTHFDDFHAADGDVESDAGDRDSGPEEDADIDAAQLDASRDAQTADVTLDMDGGGDFALEVTRDGSGVGTVTSDVGGIACGDTCSVFYAPDTMVTLTATPEATSDFTGWAGDGCTGTATTCTVTMDMARTVAATFALMEFRLDVTITGDGTGSITSGDGMITCDGSATAVCTATYPAGTVVTLTATETAGSVFSGWSGACSGTAACPVTIDADTMVGGAFDRDRRSLNVATTGTGTGNVSSAPAGIDCGMDCSEPYDLGEIVTLTASPSSNSTFAGWSGACSGSATTCMVTMSEARSVTATFTLRRYTLTVVRGGTGTGTVISTAPAGAINCGATCTTMQDHGAVVVLSAGAGTGSTFSSWSGGGCDPTTSVCLVTLTADTTVTANFAINQHIVTVSHLSGADGVGTVTSTPAGISCATGAATGCSTSFDYNTSVSLSASPAIGSEFVQWSGACGGASTTCGVTTTTDRSVTAEFRLQRFTVSVTKTGAGSGTVTSSTGGISCGGTCTAELAYGTMVTFTAAPTVGSTFAGWGGACAPAGSATTCIVSVTAAASVSASFVLGTSILTVTRNGSGRVTTSPAGIDCGSTCAASFTNGTSITLSQTAEPGHMFTGWSGACSGTGSCMVTMGTSPIAVTANFAPIPRILTVTRSGAGFGRVTSAPAGIDCSAMGGAVCSFTYDHGTMVTLTAVADAGSSFGGWGGAGATAACTSSTGPCTVTMDAARTITATFTLNTYQLDVTRIGGGTGGVTSLPAGISCGTDCTQSYTFNTMVTLTAAAGTGSTFQGWSGACTGTGMCLVTMSAARSVTARFELNRYTLTVSKTGGTGTVSAIDGSISCGTTCSGMYDHGTTVTLTAAPASGNRFVRWSGGSCSGTGSCVVQMNAAESITAVFIRQWTVTINTAEVGGYGPIVSAGDSVLECQGDRSGTGCSAVYDEGTTFTLSVNAPPWTVFSSWAGDCTGTGACTVSVTANRSITANFTRLGNLAFVTSTSHLGSVGPAGADTQCEALATAAGLPYGTYRAWLGTSTQSAQDRGSPSIDSVTGWVRPDGRPVTGRITDLLSGGMIHPLTLDELGANVGAPVTAWTGTNATGSASTETCANWTSSASASTAVVGHAQRGGGEWTAIANGASVPSVTCDVARRLYCFEIGTSYATIPGAPMLPANPGFMFVSTASFNGAAGIPAMDMACRNEATARSFPGASSYVAFVTTGTTGGASAASRVTFAGPFYRPDGWLLGDRNQVISAIGRLSTFPMFRADGSPAGNAPGWTPTLVWTGQSSGSPGGVSNGPQTCGGTWVSTTQTGLTGAPAGTAWDRWGNVNPAISCSNVLPVYCIRGS